MAKGTQVAEKPAAGAIAVNSDFNMVPEHLRQGSGLGNENVGAEDMQIPRLELAQEISDILKTHDNCEAGYLFNSVTEDVYGAHAHFIPVMFFKQYLVWKDRKAGGGFKGAFNTLEEAQARIVEAVEEEGESQKQLSVVETPTHIGLLIEPSGRIIEIAISMPRTKQKVSRRLNSMIQMAGGDRFSRIYTVGSEMVTSPGGDYFNYTFTPFSWCDPAMYEKAKAFYKQLNARGGAINVAHGDEEGAGSAADDSEI